MSELDKIMGRIKQGSPNPYNIKEEDKPRKRDVKDVKKKRPFWKSDWNK